jgi:hypothetical protein
MHEVLSSNLEPETGFQDWDCSWFFLVSTYKCDFNRLPQNRPLSFPSEYFPIHHSHSIIWSYIWAEYFTVFKCLLCDPPYVTDHVACIILRLLLMVTYCYKSKHTFHITLQIAINILIVFYQIMTLCNVISSVCLFKNRCLGEYLDLRGMKWQEGGENCIVMSSITCVDCNQKYMVQTGRIFKIRYNEHVKALKSNKST